MTVRGSSDCAKFDLLVRQPDHGVQRTGFGQPLTPTVKRVPFFPVPLPLITDLNHYLSQQYHFGEGIVKEVL